MFARAYAKSISHHRASSCQEMRISSCELVAESYIEFNGDVRAGNASANRCRAAATAADNKSRYRETLNSLNFRSND